MTRDHAAAAPPSNKHRTIDGSGAHDLAVGQARRHRLVARTLRDEVARLGSALHPDRALDALAAAGRMDLEATSWEVAIATWRGWT
ncbi:hypothetical protein [Methylibium sp.]|uniref:hypothetical protein n=1 Tax=Methylibium sp. TaxID=2067992 RepID=UPI0017BA5912|nr:hypothetical protein [Methylibium sp.]MBA3590301.1 hypothetical protein [Methylibium sp.]